MNEVNANAHRSARHHILSSAKIKISNGRCSVFLDLYNYRVMEQLEVPNGIVSTVEI